MNTYIADFWATTIKKKSVILHDINYYTSIELYDSFGYRPWCLSSRDNQFILKILPKASMNPSYTYLSGFRIRFYRDPKIDSLSPFELILRPEAEIDYPKDQFPFCNFSLVV